MHHCAQQLPAPLLFQQYLQAPQLVTFSLTGSLKRMCIPLLSDTNKLKYHSQIIVEHSNIACVLMRSSCTAGLHLFYAIITN